MYRAALRPSFSALRASPSPSLAANSRRLLSTRPAGKGTWRGAGVRWGLAITAVYFYNTSPIFTDELLREFPRRDRRLLLTIVTAVATELTQRSA